MYEDSLPVHRRILHAIAMDAEFNTPSTVMIMTMVDGLTLEIGQPHLFHLPSAQQLYHAQAQTRDMRAVKVVGGRTRKPAALT